MNKHTIVVIVASVIIAAPFVFAFWNVYALNSLQIRWSEPENFNYFTLSNDGNISICNPMPFFVSFDQFKIIPTYDGDTKGRFLIHSVTMEPNSLLDAYGEFESELYSESQYLFLHMDAQFDGTAPVRVDPRKMFVITDFQTSLFGIIPLSATSEYTAFDFDEMMRGELGNFSCEI